MTCNRTKEECTRNDCFIDTHLKQVCFHGHEVAGLIAPEPGPQLLPSENEYFKCPECNADIRFGLNAQTLEAFRQSKLFKDKPLPLAQSDQDEIVDSLLFLLRSVPEDSLKHTILQRFTITRKPQ